MEEVLVLAVQFVAEVLLQAVVYLPFDLPLSRDEKTGGRTGCGWPFVYLVVGGVVGGLSLLVAPRLLIHSAPLRLANLVVAPVVAGGVSWGVAAWRRSRGATTCPRTHFWAGFWFVLAFGGVRLAYAAQ
ncbi:MAG: hypothetical protein C0501_00585 [Isosphaera sp.]|nr:hypothetical protein [Isosphaera sp.]